MSRLRRVLIAVVVVVLVAAVGGYWYERPMLLTGTGYAAHNACALASIAGRTNASADLPPNPLVPVLRSSVKGHETTSSVLGVLATQHAWSTDGFGCTVADRAPDLPEPTVIVADENINPYLAVPEPTETPALAAALDHAFGDDLDDAGRVELGTRAVVVVKNGELVAERYADGFDKDTPQLGWSMSKSVANLITGRLAAQGKVTLDDAALRPEWTDRRAAITIRDLLQMTSGLFWDETYDLGTPITAMLYLEPDMAGYVASQKAVHRPGTHLQYSSGDTNLLCSVLAEREGGANLPRTQIFAPLGLSTAVMEPDAVGTPVCSSYLWATPREWATIGQFALQDGVWNGTRLLPPGWMSESVLAVDVDSEEQNPYGTGWWPNRAADGSLREADIPADAYFAQGHDGQRITVVPSEDLVVVRLGFSPSADDDRSLSTVTTVIDARR